MTSREKAESRLNCIYAAVNVMGMNNALRAEQTKRPTTEEVLVEAKKISEWVLPKKGE